MAYPDEKQQKQKNFWETLICKYELRGGTLGNNPSPNNNTKDEQPLCKCNPNANKKGTSESKPENIMETPSIFSLTSADLEYITKLKQILEDEKKLKKQLKVPEDEGGFFNRLWGPKECSCECKPTREDLIKENKQLKDEVEDLKLEIKQYVEKIEGPIARLIQSEKCKNEFLEEELMNANKTAMGLQENYIADTNALKMQLQNACKHLCELNAANAKLKDELADSESKCDELEEQLIEQKLHEAESLKKLLESKRSPSNKNTPNSFDCKCKPKMKNAAAGDDPDTLHSIAQNLSKALQDVDDCGFCEYTVPPDLKDTVRGIKNLVDLVDSRGKKYVTDENDMEQCPCKDSTPEPTKQNPKSQPRPMLNDDPQIPECLCEALETEPPPEPECLCGAPESEPQPEPECLCGAPEPEPQSEPECLCGAPEPEPQSEPECLCGAPEPPPESDKNDDVCDCGSPSPVKKKPSPPAPPKTKELSCSCAEPENEPPMQEPPCRKPSKPPSSKREELPSKSCKCSAVEEEPEQEYCINPQQRIPSKKESPPRSKTSLPKSPTTSKPCNAACSKTPNEVVPSPAPPDDIEVQMRLEAGDEIEVDVNAEVECLEEGDDQILVTTAVTDSGTLEVTTEGPAGKIETVMTYTDSGNIEVLTEITEYDEDNPKGSDADKKAIEDGTAPGGDEFFRKLASEIEPGGNEPDENKPNAVENTVSQDAPKSESEYFGDVSGVSGATLNEEQPKQDKPEVEDEKPPEATTNSENVAVQDEPKNANEEPIEEPDSQEKTPNQESEDPDKHEEQVVPGDEVQENSAEEKAMPVDDAQETPLEEDSEKPTPHEDVTPEQSEPPTADETPKKEDLPIDTDTLRKDVTDALNKVNKNVMDALDAANKHVMDALEKANKDVETALTNIVALSVTPTETCTCDDKAKPAPKQDETKSEETCICENDAPKQNDVGEVREDDTCICTTETDSNPVADGTGTNKETPEAEVKQETPTPEGTDEPEVKQDEPLPEDIHEVRSPQPESEPGFEVDQRIELRDDADSHISLSLETEITPTVASDKKESEGPVNEIDIEISIEADGGPIESFVHEVVVNPEADDRDRNKLKEIENKAASVRKEQSSSENDSREEKEKQLAERRSSRRRSSQGSRRGSKDSSQRRKSSNAPKGSSRHASMEDISRQDSGKVRSSKEQRPASEPSKEIEDDECACTEKCECEFCPRGGKIDKRPTDDKGGSCICIPDCHCGDEDRSTDKKSKLEDDLCICTSDCKCEKCSENKESADKANSCICMPDCSCGDEEKPKPVIKGHPSDCCCISCLCDPPENTSAPSTEVKHTISCECSLCRYDEVQSIDKKMQPSTPEEDQCICSTSDCKCEQCSESNETPGKADSMPDCSCDDEEKSKPVKAHSSDCCCISCLCDPPENTSAPPTQAKHTASCDCSLCHCDPCADPKKAPKKDAEKPHTEGCICEDCLCVFGVSPISKEHSSDCACIDCIYDAAPEPEEVKNVPDNIHDKLCQCPTCQCCECKPCQPVTHQITQTVPPDVAQDTTEKCACEVADPEKEQSESCSCPICTCPGADLMKTDESMQPLCDCETCNCDDCPGVNVPKSIENMENEDQQLKNDMKELKDSLEQIRCACAAAETQATPTQMAPIQATMSGLQVALDNLQDKCKVKDQMIEALTQELKMRADSKIFDNLLKNLATAPPPAADYDRTEICGVLPRPVQDPSYGKPSHRVQECSHPNYPNCSCAQPEAAKNPPRPKSTDKTCKDTEACPLESEKPPKSCPCAEPTKPPPVKKSTAASPPKKPTPTKPDNCVCEGPKPPAKKQEPKAPPNSCLCPQGGLAVDPAPLDVTDVRKVSPDSLLVKWIACENELITGYEIEVDGVLKSRVHSRGRTNAVVHGLEIKVDLNIDVFAVTKNGRCLPPAKAIFHV